MTTDFLKNELSTGDNIVFIHPRHRQLVVGQVKRVLPQKLEVVFTNDNGRADYTFRWPEDCIRV